MTWNPEFRLATLDDIRAAAARMPDVVRTTPIVPVARASSEVGDERLFVKCENLQVTGAYKVRAAFNLMGMLTPEERAKGIVMTSSGNFAQAFGYAGKRMGVPIVVVMLDHTSAYKVEATKGYGAHVHLAGDNAAARQSVVEQVAAERGMAAVDTWEDERIPPGHGTIGLELLEQCPDVEQVLVPVSSGGMAAGVATAVKSLRPEVRVIGVQPERANAAYVSMQAGEPTHIDYWDSIADGLSAVRPGERPFAHLQAFMDEIVLISESDIAHAFVTLLDRAKLQSEPAGAVASAAFLAGKVDTSKKTVAVLSGGNLTHQSRLRMFDMAGLAAAKT